MVFELPFKSGSKDVEKSLVFITSVLALQDRVPLSPEYNKEGKLRSPLCWCLSVVLSWVI